MLITVEFAFHLPDCFANACQTSRRQSGLISRFFMSLKTSLWVCGHSCKQILCGLALRDVAKCSNFSQVNLITTYVQKFAATNTWQNSLIIEKCFLSETRKIWTSQDHFWTLKHQQKYFILPTKIIYFLFYQPGIF